MGSFPSSENIYIVNRACGLSMVDTALYSTARISPISLKYYGFCLKNGNYTVRLHFAEISCTEENDSHSKGKRVFNVKIQNETRLSNFNIEEAAGGLNKEFYEDFPAVVRDNLLEIHFYWAGKGSFSTAQQLGPLISAIAVSPCRFVPFSIFLFVPTFVGTCLHVSDDSNMSLDSVPKSRKLSGVIVAGIAGSTLFLLVLVVVFIWKMGFLGGKKLPSEGKAGEYASGSLASPPTDLALVSQLRGLELQTDGAVVAVKQLSSKSKQGNREFVNEIGMISALQHTNLVKLYGCCIEGNQLLLIYEYMENNSLARVLFGYMAPEYAMRGYLTDKADVYSFGIVALEIVSGESNTNYRPKEEFVYLLDWAYYLKEQGNLLELVDPSLGSNFSREEAMRMLNIALLCTNSSPTLRPAMSAVVSMLEGQIPVQAPLVKRTSRNEDLRFKAFGKPSQDSQTHISSFSQDSQIHRNISMEGPLLDSSMSLYSEEETTYHSSSSKLP
ncbi:hypothetical protein HHK36_023473 [Tetracentron sinense]|uniref:non-specific serine/threonine protein kinase n=1 Tax=Tetracentron sinense TaxID=13715 RepID=A0A835D7Y4_TETSI|nr:hypothetical protein HHK36_023473 [Tetracentron sinense]